MPSTISWVTSQRSCIAAPTSRVWQRPLGFRPEALEDDLIGVPRPPRALRGRAHRPAQQGAAEDIARNKGRCGRQVVDAEGHEIGLATGRSGVDASCRALGGRCSAVGRGVVTLGDNAARAVRNEFAQGEHLVRIERHADGAAVVGRQHLGHSSDEPAVAVEMALHLDS